MGTLFVADGDAVVRLDEADGGWSARTLLSGARAQCVAIGEAGLWVGSRGGGLLRGDGRGERWRDAGLPAQDVFSVAVSPADGAVYAGCEPSMVFRSRDGGSSWEELDALRRIPSAPRWSFPPRPWTSHVRWIAPSPHDAAVVLCGIELGGVMRTADDGASFADHASGAVPDVHCLAWHPTAPGRVYEAGGDGTSWSADGGATWRRVDAGRDVHYTWALAVAPEDPDCWFVSASPGPFQAHDARRSAEARIYRWRGEGPWEALGGGLPQPLDTMPYALAFDGDRLLAGLADGTLYWSADRGDTWELGEVAGDAPDQVLALVVRPLGPVGGWRPGR
jgi:hypothetical protein